MSAGTTTIYQVALNLLPVPPVQIRHLHAVAPDATALAALTAADLVEVLGPDAPTLAELAPAGQPDLSPRDGWWARVVAGKLGYGSPLPWPPGPGEDGAALLDRAVSECRRTSALGIEVLTLDDARYPSLLAAIHAPPLVLYVRGDLEGVFPAPARAAPHAAIHSAWWSGDDGAAMPVSCDEPLRVAVVGSRRASDYGLGVARASGRALAEAGVHVVSGLALGIDAAAHHGALDAPGRTIAVLGGGLADVDAPQGGLAAASWPLRNTPLALRIPERGAVVSEYPLGTPPLPAHFPRRNRIIAGLCPAVALVEAASRSGALTTARLALEEGREVFAVPGRITTTTAAGCNALILEGAARALLSPGQLLDELPDHWKSGVSARILLKGCIGGPLPVGLTALQARLIELLQMDDTLPLDALVGRSAEPAGTVLAALMSLEIQGVLKTLPGGFYRLGAGPFGGN